MDWLVAGGRGGVNCLGHCFEHNRSNPLLNTHWLSSGSILRLGLIMLLIRIVLAEQNTGVIGWLQYAGLQNEQMGTLAGRFSPASSAGLSPAV